MCSDQFHPARGPLREAREGLSAERLISRWKSCSTPFGQHGQHPHSSLKPEERGKGTGATQKRSERSGPATPVLTPPSPGGSGFDPQHVPAVLAVADPANGIRLLFGEADTHAGGGTLPTVVTQVDDGGVKRLWTQGEGSAGRKGPQRW